MQSFIPFCVFENKYIPKNIEQKRGGGEGKRNEILYIFPRPDEDIFQQQVYCSTTQCLEHTVSYIVHMRH